MGKKARIIETAVLIIAFLSLIIIPIHIKQKNQNSSDLRTRVKESGNWKRTDFVDESGKIVLAADKGYASVLKTYEDGHVIQEQYLDDNGEAVMLPEGYSIIRREYKSGLNTVISYLDKESRPVVTKNGYDSVHMTYYPSGKTDTYTFYINGVQIERDSGYWQIKRVYKDGKLAETRYMDREGALSTDTTFGYAIVRRYYTETGREDYYYDAKDTPVSLSLGQYGIRTENGTTTYLDTDGHPMNTTKGYAIIKREGNKTLYYDKDGQPVTIGRSQYGEEISDGQTVYLDEKGEQMVRLDNLLNTNQTLVVLISVFLTILAVWLKGRAKTAFTVIYILCIVYMTMWYRETGVSKGVFTLFWSYRQMLSDPVICQEVINNIWLFIPIGAALYEPQHRCRWLICIAFSIFIEAVQYYTGIGLAEYDDIISNSLGTLIGYRTASNIFYWIKGRKDNH